MKQVTYTIFAFLSVAFVTACFAQSQGRKELPIIANPTINFANDARAVPVTPHSPVILDNFSPWSSDYRDYGVNGAVFAIASMSHTYWGAVLLGGQFDSVGAVAATSIAKYDPNRDTVVAYAPGISAGVVNTLIFESDSGVYAGGNFTLEGMAEASSVAKWDGHTWTSMASAAGGSVLALARYHGRLYAGGNFTTIGGVTANHIAVWDSSAASWKPILDSGVNGVDGGVAALLATDEGLYVGGGFEHAGTVGANKIALLSQSSSTSWLALGSGLKGTNSFVTAIQPYYSSSTYSVCGNFSDAGGEPAGNFALWRSTGSSWDPNHPHFNGTTHFAKGDAQLGYVVGEFTMIDTFISPYFASVAPLYPVTLPTLDGPAYVLAGDWIWLLLQGYGNPVYIGGTFTNAGGKPSPNFVIYYGPMGGGVAKSDASRQELRLFPNPASTSTRVSLPQECKELVVADELGRIRMRLAGSDVLQTTASLDVHTLERGSYIIACTTPNGIFRSTLLIQR
ncbi:MAG: T9SS type A sorting domain-containing protein [Bacteroidetes bacterium]|nr:T9SS type A sorting domain-containing protein [Bacteroidota bacterium]